MSGSTTAERDVPDPNEMYCPQCGETTPKGDTACKHCGGPLFPDAQNRMSPQKLRQYGWISAILAYVVLPIVFAPIAFYLGRKLQRYDEAKGLRLIVAAIGAIVVWGLLVVYIL